MSGIVMGSPSYMSPEQTRAQNDLVNVCSDVYSLGAILYELLTGHAPFLAATVVETLRQVQDEEPVSPRLLNKAVPVDLETICLKCLEKAPQKRYASARALAEDLRRFLNREPIMARPVSPFEKAAKWARRRPASAALVGVSVLAALGFVIGGIWYNAQLRAARDRATVSAENERVEAERALRAETEARKQQAEAEKARKSAEHNLANAELAQAGMFTDAGRFTEAHSLFASCQAKFQKLGESDFSVKAGLTELYAASPPALLTFKGHSNGVFGVAFSPDGERALSGGYDHAVRLWEVKTGRELQAFKGLQRVVYSVAFSPDGQLAVSGGIDKTISLWDIATGREIRTLVGNRNPVQSVTFSPDGKRILSSGWEPTVRLWDVASGQEIRRFAGHAGNVHGSAYAPDGRWALSGSLDKTLKLWQIEPSQEIRAFAGHTTEIRDVTVSADGRFALSSSGDGTVRVWDMATGFALQTFTNKVSAIGLSADGKRVLAARYSRLMVWNIETGAEICGMPGKFFRAAISPDGKWALSGCYTPVEGLTLWDLTTGTQIRELKNGALPGLACEKPLGFVNCAA
jgi:hypothetical protein